MAENKDWQFSLKPPRPKIENSGPITAVLTLDILLRFAGCVYCPNVAHIDHMSTGKQIKLN
jgi:hypothetical protein